MYAAPESLQSAGKGPAAAQPAWPPLKPEKASIGIERDSRDFDVAVKRIKEAAEAAQTERIKGRVGFRVIHIVSYKKFLINGPVLGSPLKTSPTREHHPRADWISSTS